MILCDILQQLHQDGILKKDEKVITQFNAVIFTERFTGKRFSYRAIDLNSFETHFLCSKGNKLPEDRYNQLKVMLNGEIVSTAKVPPMLERCNEERAYNLLEKLFKVILPNLGFSYRTEQENLSLTILNTLQSGKVALCEAGVGTGKTHAYILATVIHNLFQKQKTSTVLSTSSIPLQKAITEEYLPQISDLLQKECIIEKPLRFVVRKGKGHYFCKQRAISYCNSITGDTQKRSVFDILKKLIKTQGTLDLEEIAMASYIKKKISVTHCDRNCGFAKKCAYRSFLSQCKANFYDFQIVNHNYFIADLLVKRRGNHSLLADCGQVIVDEAHKLPSTIWDMYGLSLNIQKIPQMLNQIMKYRNKKLIHHSQLLKVNESFFEDLKKGQMVDNEYEFTSEGKHQLTKLLGQLKLTQVVITGYKDKSRAIPPYIFWELEETIEILENLKELSHWIFSFHPREQTITILPKDLASALYEDLWQQATPMIFTSGTLSVGEDFGYFKSQMGLEKYDGNVIEMMVDSPFDYYNNGILYLPEDIPYPDIGDEEYIPDVANRVCELIRATHGHALILFTSYRLMERVYEKVKEEYLSFPLFIIQKGEKNPLTAFRKSNNGVLFATDSMGEGIDLAGDILSSVVVIKLPFPVPTALSNYEREQEENFEDFIDNSVIPAMLTKLRQWIGRGIRTETDTCVFSILDARATKKYKDVVLNALPEMPVVTEIGKVEEFIQKNKGSDYFG